MARTKLTARKSTGGKVPRKQQVKEIVQRPKNVTQPLALITKKFRKIRTYSDILYIAKRIFQKDPSLIEEIKNQIGNVANNDNVVQARTKILSMISLALEKRLWNSNGELVSLPTDPENYLSFCELVEVSANPHTKCWFTFVLKDLSEEENFHSPDGDVPLIKMRKRIKNNLSKEYLTSVQMEIRALENIEMVMFRIATTKITKKKENDEARLLKAKPTFLAYFPGEPYFYADSAKPNAERCDALMEVLKCSAYDDIPLNGRHLESLRQLRQNRDEPEEIENDLWEDNDEHMPKLNHFSVKAVKSISKENKEIMLEDMTATIDIKGTDVLNGLKFLTENSDIILDPLPSWATKAVYRGRNHINIKPTTCSPTKNILPMVQASTSSRRIVMNEISVMGSEADKTVFNRRK